VKTFTDEMQSAHTVVVVEEFKRHVETTPAKYISFDHHPMETKDKRRRRLVYTEVDTAYAIPCLFCAIPDPRMLPAL
jgi:hypothetical protein